MEPSETNLLRRAGDAAPEVSVIIVNWNSSEFLRRCLASLVRFTAGVSYEVIVIDNASFDGCDAMLAEHFPAVQYLQSAENLGFARANNLAAKTARGGFFLFLNPDTELLENFIPALRDPLIANPGSGAAGCRLLNADRSIQRSCVQSFPTLVNQLLDFDLLQRLFPNSGLWGNAVLSSASQTPAEVEAVSGACLIVERALFERVRGFTESYFMYGEDLDLCRKIKDAGRQVLYVPGASLIHYGGGSEAVGSSATSNVRMRQAVHHFFRLHRGSLAASAYRLAMAVSALVRLPLLCLQPARSPRRDASLGKWKAILRWSLGLAPKPAHNPAANSFAALTGH